MQIITLVPYSVYTLVDPRNQDVFYVGQTTNLHARYLQHMQPCTNQEKSERIQEILALDLLPIMCVIETSIDKDRIDVAEVFWIDFYLKKDVPLTNIQFVDRSKYTKDRKIETPNEKQYIEQPKREQREQSVKKSYRDQPCESKLYTFTHEEEPEVIELHKQGLDTNHILDTMRKGRRYRFEVRRIVGEYENDFLEPEDILKPLDWSQYNFGVELD